MSDFQLKRLGLLMEPEPGNPHEVGGVLNPAAVRGHDGNLYLFPRLVAKDNYSRIGIARGNSTKPVIPAVSNDWVSRSNRRRIMNCRRTGSADVRTLA